MVPVPAASVLERVASRVTTTAVLRCGRAEQGAINRFNISTGLAGSGRFAGELSHSAHARPALLTPKQLPSLQLCNCNTCQEAES